MEKDIASAETSCPHDAKLSEILDKVDEVLAEERVTRTVLAKMIQEFQDHFDGTTYDM